MHCVILVLFTALHQTSAAVTTNPATTDTTPSTSASTGLQSSLPGNWCYNDALLAEAHEGKEQRPTPNVTVHRKTDHFPQKLKFKLLLLVDTSIFAECNGS